MTKNELARAAAIPIFLPHQRKEVFMKRLFAIAVLAAAAATAVTPALAANSRLQERGYGHAERYHQTHRGFAADRSFGNRTGLNVAKQTGRCVEDLGYGRFVYCGW
jgi:hypothetical protein